MPPKLKPTSPPAVFCTPARMVTLPLAKDDAIVPDVSLRPISPPTLLWAPAVTVPLALDEVTDPEFTPASPPTLFSEKLVVEAPTVTFAAEVDPVIVAPA